MDLSNLLFPKIDCSPETLLAMEARFPERGLPEGANAGRVVPDNGAGAVVSRMAPSPTGFVHLGNLVQGLTSERMTHQSRGGVLYLRIEDTDLKREVKGAVETLIDGLSHYGINFDEGATVSGDKGLYGPYRQRQRAAIYHVYAKRLVEQGMAYPCFCNEGELEALHAAQEAAKANFGYYGQYAPWRDAPIERVIAELDKKTPYVLRFRAPDEPGMSFKFTDLIKGEVAITPNDNDYVLLKSDGIPTYHFAHAVDDHLMRTTHVVRGDEWLPSLPFHLQLFRALGWKPPKYLHIGPLMKMDGNSKRKLSKRKDPELALSYYKAEGYPVAAVKEYLMNILNSNFEDWRRANPDAQTESFQFSYKKMNPAGSLFDIDKLRDVSRNVISRMSADEVFTLAAEWADEYDRSLSAVLRRAPEYAKDIFSIGRGGSKPRRDIDVWANLKAYVSPFYDEYFAYEDKIPAVFDRAEVTAILHEFIDGYSTLDDGAVWFDKVKSVAAAHGYAPDMKLYKENPSGYKGSVADVSMFIRIAVTGRQNSPDLASVMRILGEERCRERVERFERI